LATTSLARLRKALRQDGMPVADIRLAPLDIEELGALIDDCCYRIRNLPALLQRVLQETQGRPAAVLQFLARQVQEGHLHYEGHNRHWCWTDGTAPVDHSAALAGLWWRDGM
jgi:predicted ATPase